MKKTDSLFILVKSLSKAEKRYFHLFSNLQSGNKVYTFLFDLLDNNDSIDDVHLKFCQKQDGKSFEMAAKYLYRILLDCLVKLREKDDIQAHIYNKISKAAILFDRELFDNAFAELRKAEKLAVDFEKDALLLLIRRTELKYLSALNFEGISESELVSKQMRINETSKYSRNINQHRQLHDILKYRITHKGYARSDKQKDGLNDLVLSELNLIANNSYTGFEAQKLHLLFQAAYYLNSGNYKSAIRYYQELISLFDENQHLLLNPPIYYFSAIHGILDSLNVAGIYREMPPFISKLKELEMKGYSVEFTLKVRTAMFYHESSRYIQIGEFDMMRNLMDEYNESLLKNISLLGLEEQLKIYLYTLLFHFCTGDLILARKSMKKILGSGKLFHAFPLYKTVRLINLLLQAELGNSAFFENEISSIKRNIHFEKHVYATEKLLFKFVLAFPLPSYEKTRDKLWMQYKKEIQKIEQSKYERQLLKTFDFLAWIESKLTRRSFVDVLKR